MDDNDKEQVSTDTDNSVDNVSADSDSSSSDDVDSSVTDNNDSSNDISDSSSNSSYSKKNGIGEGLARSNREAFARGLGKQNYYKDRIAKNRDNLNNARDQKNDPYKMRKGHEGEKKHANANDSSKDNFDKKSNVDKIKDQMNVLGAGASLAASHVDDFRSKAYMAQHPVEAGKMVAKQKIKKVVFSWLAGAAVGCAPYILGVLVAAIAVLFIVGLFNGESDDDTGVGAGTGVCSYNVDGKTVSNIKVRLLNCEGDTAVAGEELIDFETYITGVVYQEIGDASYEALKAQAVAARSFALTRPGIMGGAYGISLEEKDGQWILSLRSCTNDQVFCNPNKGCWSDVEGGQTSDSEPENWPNCTVHSGYAKDKKWTRKSLADDSNIRKAVEETKGEVLVDSNGKIVNTDFTNTNQERWNSLALGGRDYFEILMKDYGGKGASKIEKNCETGTSTINSADINKLIKMSQAEAWEQLIGRKTDEGRPAVSHATMNSRVTTIKVPIRTWKSGSGHNPSTDTEKKEVNITVNKALADLWLAFYTDVYNEATDFVIASMDGCYNYRTGTGSNSLSAHAYGVACDINASTRGNGYGEDSYSKSKWQSLPESRAKYQVVYKESKVMEIAHKYTLINGSDWSSPNDAMHFSFIRDKTRSFAQACQGKLKCPS